MLYQQIQVSTGNAVGSPAALPADLQGLADASLSDLPAALDPCPPQYADTGFTPYAPPPTPAPAPTSSYISKEMWLDRLTNAQYAAFDSLTLQVQARPVDWSTNQNAPWPQLAPMVRPIGRFNAADSLNLLDAGFVATVQAFAAQNPTLFGADAASQAAEVARIMDPALTPAEAAEVAGSQ